MSPHDIVLIVGLAVAAIAQFLIHFLFLEPRPEPRPRARGESTRVRTTS